MKSLATTLTETFVRFSESEKAGGFVLAACTVLSLLIANSALGPGYADFWQTKVVGLSLAHWVNDALMAIFFLLIGLELERELYSGELSKPRKALLPLIAALGGMAAPALIHFSLNGGTPTAAGVGIPMATDIAFALGALALLGSRIPASLKVFLVAFAVIDDLGAVIIIAVFYTPTLSLAYFAAAAAVFAVLVVMNVKFRVMALWPYLLGGAILWFCMLKSGVHATIAGVLLAFAIPYSSTDGDKASPSHRLEVWLHKPVAFLILPIFAFANTAIVISETWVQDLMSANSIGIAAGLVLGKPLGVTLFCLLAVWLKLVQLPADLTWRHVIGAGMLGGIGFTMSIFITNLAFTESAALVTASKMAILMASLTAGVLGYIWLRFVARPVATSA